jgi:dTDP-4-dehydrorhamnose 3,5-epimerase
MTATTSPLTDLKIIVPKQFADDRGFFLETWNRAAYESLDIPAHMVQDNLSWSRRGVLRGLHYQWPNPQGKLVYVLSGEIFDVAVDIRVGSPTFGAWAGFTLSSADMRQLYIPPGYAHGFCVVSEEALVAYKCTERYHAECDANLAWDDPDVGIEWPIDSPILSDKDRLAPRLRDISEARLPRDHADSPAGLNGSHGRVVRPR